MPARPARARWLHPAQFGQHGTQADSRRTVPRWQRAAQHADTLRTAAGRAVETAPSSGPRRYINFDLIFLLSWRTMGTGRRRGKRRRGRRRGRPPGTTRGPTGSGVPAAERRGGSFKLVMGQAWRGICG
jgi:hypothetical protein